MFTRCENHIPEDPTEEISCAADLIMTSLGIAESINPIAMSTACGALQRHPGLEFGLVERGIG